VDQSFLPMNEQMLSAALSTYAKVAGLTGGLAFAIFTARVSVLTATVEGPSAFADALKSLIAFFISLALAPVVFKAIILSTGHIAAEIGRSSLSTHETSEQAGVFSELMKVAEHDSPILAFAIHVIPFSVGYLASSIYSIILGAVCAVTPIILLYYELSNSSQSLRAVASTVLVLSSWPILWNVMALLAKEIWPSFSHTTVASIVFWSVIKILQLLSPLFSVLFFKSFSMTGLSRGQAILRSIPKIKMKD